MPLFSRIKNSVKVLLGTAEVKKSSVVIERTNYVCPVCNKDNVNYTPLNPVYIYNLHKFGFDHSIFKFETLNWSQYNCSNCKANDRDRLAALFFKRTITDDKNNLSLLDIAPSNQLSSFFKKFNALTVRTADLMMQDVDDTNMDITSMPYKDENFDIFICSHVLEHIEDDAKAMSELFRVLKKGGWGLAMAPIHTGINSSIENKTINSVEDRWRFYGQDDHVRLYSKNDFISRLTKAGFKVSQLGIEYFGEDAFFKAGIFPSSILYIVYK